MERRRDDSFQREVLTTLGDIKALCATNTANQEAVSARVTKIEKAAERQWWVSYVVTPSLVLLGHVARAFGAKI